LFGVKRKLFGNNILGGIIMKEDKIEQIALALEKAKLGEYVEMMSKPGKMLLNNFIAGLARGFGMAIGFTILGALALYFMRALVMLNLPFIGGFIAEIVKIVQDHL